MTSDERRMLLDDLLVVWDAHHLLRLGQLVEWMACREGGLRNHAFYVTDEWLWKMIKRQIEVDKLAEV